MATIDDYLDWKFDGDERADEYEFSEPVLLPEQKGEYPDETTIIKPLHEQYAEELMAAVQPKPYGGHAFIQKIFRLLRKTRAAEKNADFFARIFEQGWYHIREEIKPGTTHTWIPYAKMPPGTPICALALNENGVLITLSKNSPVTGDGRCFYGALTFYASREEDIGILTSKSDIEAIGALCLPNGPDDELIMIGPDDKYRYAIARKSGSKLNKQIFEKTRYWTPLGLADSTDREQYLSLYYGATQQERERLPQTLGRVDVHFSGDNKTFYISDTIYRAEKEIEKVATVKIRLEDKTTGALGCMTEQREKIIGISNTGHYIFTSQNYPKAIQVFNPRTAKYETNERRIGLGLRICGICIDDLKIMPDNRTIQMRSGSKEYETRLKKNKH